MSSAGDGRVLNALQAQHHLQVMQDVYSGATSAQSDGRSSGVGPSPLPVAYPSPYPATPDKGQTGAWHTGAPLVPPRHVAPPKLPSAWRAAAEATILPGTLQPNAFLGSDYYQTKAALATAHIPTVAIPGMRPIKAKLHDPDAVKPSSRPASNVRTRAVVFLPF